MGQIEDVKRNRKVMDDSTVDSPYVPSLGDQAVDTAEMLFGDNLPEDNVGFMPSNEKNRSKR
jgi:hypothetical protein